MLRVCMFCDRVFGEKEPLFEKTSTHGICDPCFDEFRMKCENQGTAKMKNPNWQTRQTDLLNSTTIRSGGQINSEELN